MATIYAVLVGIDDYPGRPLAGCVNDVKAFMDYLKSMPGEQSSLIARVLTAPGASSPDQLPTRANIIKAFEIFEDAKSGDSCIFYYSGHGSYSNAPAEFESSNGRVQSFVCHDSRQPGGKDLMDKEMGFLIWKTVTARPDIHFVAITDCCHSGSIVRAIDNKAVTERLMMNDGHVPARVEDYLGFDVTVGKERPYEVVAGPSRKVNTRQGPHIHLAASRNNQTSKELMIDGIIRGAFTYSLLKVLYASGGGLSYLDVMEQTQASVKNLVPGQDPDISVNGDLPPSEKEKVFLGQKYAGANPKYLVYYDLKYGWSLKGGLVHGISKGDIVRIEGVCKTIVTGFSSADTSIILGKLELGRQDKTYFAEVDRQPNQALTVSLASDIEPAVGDWIRQARVDAPSPFVSLLPEQLGRLIIRSKLDGLTYLTLPGSDAPYFIPLKVDSPGSGIDFLQRVEKVGRWMHLLAFNNPRQDLTREHYSIRLFITGQIVDYSPKSLEELKEIEHVNDLCYRKKDQDWDPPAFRLVIKNNTDGTLYITAAYLGFDYSIQPSQFQLLELGPCMEKALSYVGKGGLPQEVVKVRLDTKYQELGYTDITEYLKLFVSTQKIDVRRLKQAGLETPPVKAVATRGPRSLGGEEEESKELAAGSWRTETIGFRIIRPSH